MKWFYRFAAEIAIMVGRRRLSKYAVAAGVTSIAVTSPTPTV
jgi:hypothetical protein